MFDMNKKKKSKKRINRDALPEAPAITVPTDNMAGDGTTGEDDFSYEFVSLFIWTHLVVSVEMWLTSTKKIIKCLSQSESEK